MVSNDIRRAEEAVVEAGMAASLIFNNYEDPKRQDKLLMAMVNLGSKCEVLHGLRASQAGEPCDYCFCLRGYHHKNIGACRHCQECPAYRAPSTEKGGDRR